MIGPPWIRPGNSSEYCTPRLFYFPTIPSRTRTSALSSYCKCDVFRMQKKIDTRYCPVLQHRIPPLSETICFSSCFLKARLLNTQSTLIGQLTHAWLSVVKQSSCAQSILMCQNSCSKEKCTIPTFYSGETANVKERLSTSTSFYCVLYVRFLLCFHRDWRFWT